MIQIVKFGRLRRKKRMKEIEITEIILKNFVEKIRPDDLEVRKQVDIGYNWDGSIAYLDEIRPQWNKHESILHRPFAKLRYYKSRNEWNLYWMRGNGNWELYKPHPIGNNIQELLEVIEEDAFACFFG